MSVIGVGLLWIWDSFTLWLYNLFVAPFTNLEIFWILAPVYVGLFLAEFFQEKKGTSLGNAISNSVIALWGGIDFLRITVHIITTTAFTIDTFKRIFICILIISYGLYIIYLGVKVKGITKYLGRIREVSYIIIVFAPIYYTDSKLTIQYIFGAVAFFYLFYLGLEIINQFTPDPAAFVQDLKEASSMSPSSPTPPINRPNFSGGKR